MQTFSGLLFIVGLQGFLWGFGRFCGVTGGFVGVWEVLWGFGRFCGGLGGFVGLQGVLWALREVWKIEKV